MKMAISSGSVCTATDHQSTAASASGLNRYTISGMRMAGRLPNSVRSTRSRARQAASTRTRMTSAVSVQSYSAACASTQDTAKPSGAMWPALTSIRYFQVKPSARARSKL